MPRHAAPILVHSLTHSNSKESRVVAGNARASCGHVHQPVGVLDFVWTRYNGIGVPSRHATPRRAQAAPGAAETVHADRGRRPGTHHIDRLWGVHCSFELVLAAGESRTPFEFEIFCGSESVS